MAISLIILTCRIPPQSFSSHFINIRGYMHDFIINASRPHEAVCPVISLRGEMCTAAYILSLMLMRIHENGFLEKLNLLQYKVLISDDSNSVICCGPIFCFLCVQISENPFTLACA